MFDTEQMSCDSPSSLITVDRKWQVGIDPLPMLAAVAVESKFNRIAER